MLNKTCTSGKIRLYEGCIVKLKGREELLYVKGIIEEEGRYIALPRYIPDKSGDRTSLVNCRRYRVLKRYEEQITYVKKNLDRILRYSKIFKRKIPMISEEEVDIIYEPTEKLKEIMRQPALPIDNTIIKICNHLLRKIPQRYVGIAGSRLADLTGPEQDIDLVITDLRYTRNVLEIFKELKSRDKRIITKLVEFHKNTIKIPNIILHNLLSRRNLENSIDGYQYFVRILPMIDYKPVVKYYEIDTVGPVLVHVKVSTDSPLPYTSPCIYRVESSLGDIYLISDRGIFSETLLLLGSFKVYGIYEIGRIELFEEYVISRWIYLSPNSFITF